jgi:hypothetical protein
MPTQRGRAFLIILVALAIAAFLSRDALLAYFGKASSPAGAARSRLPPAVHDSDVTGPTSVPGAPIERARAVEDVVQKRADDAAKRIDGAAR